jgi:hypothetical protein
MTSVRFEYDLSQKTMSGSSNLLNDFFTKKACNHFFGVSEINSVNSSLTMDSINMSK